MAADGVDMRQLGFADGRAAVPSHINLWAIGAGSTIVGLVGLYISSQSTTHGAYYGGIVLFLTAFVLNFLLVKRLFDKQERSRRH